MNAIVLLGSMLALIAIGVPVAFSMGIAALVGALFIGIPWEAVALKLADGVSKFSLLAIPFFILAGAIMAEGGMAHRLVNMANVFVGFIRGGLSLVNVLASMFFGGISGSSVADASSIGSILIPIMEREGYDKEFAVNVTITGSVQGILIPPSHNMVIYSLAAGGTVSIAQLFMAGIIPGIMLGLFLMALCLLLSYQRQYPKGKLVPLRQAVRTIREALWGLFTVFIILCGVMFGIFTATESAAVAALYAFLVTMFVYRDYRWRDLPQLAHRTAKTVSMVMMLIAMASGFGYVMALMQLPGIATEFFLTLSNNVYVILALINLLLLFLGCIMDMAPLILICTPILLPVVKSFGVDPVHFGIIMMLNLSIGLVTPPVGSTLFVGCAIGKVPMERLVKTIWPFYLSMLLVLVIITYVPFVSLWIPSLMKFTP